MFFGPRRLFSILVIKTRKWTGKADNWRAGSREDGQLAGKNRRHRKEGGQLAGRVQGRRTTGGQGPGKADNWRARSREGGQLAGTVQGRRTTGGQGPGKADMTTYTSHLTLHSAQFTPHTSTPNQHLAPPSAHLTRCDFHVFGGVSSVELLCARPGLTFVSNSTLCFATNKSSACCHCSPFSHALIAAL